MQIALLQCSFSRLYSDYFAKIYKNEGSRSNLEEMLVVDDIIRSEFWLTFKYFSLLRFTENYAISAKCPNSNLSRWKPKPNPLSFPLPWSLHLLSIWVSHSDMIKASVRSFTIVYSKPKYNNCWFGLLLTSSLGNWAEIQLIQCQKYNFFRLNSSIFLNKHTS